LRRLYAGFTLSDKAMLEGAQGRIITADAVEMARIAFGGTLPTEPVIGDVINVNSPLTYDDRMLGGLITYARAGQVCIITPFILAGAMSPISIAAALAQQNAEALAGIALTQLVRPGAPVVYGGFTTNTDMRSGSPAFGTPEGAWALLAGAQLARHYRLPYRGSGSLTSAKLADAQAATETMWNLWPCVLGHANLVMHAAGWLEGGLTISFEKLMIDAEQLAMFAHFMRGFPIDDSSLALDSIAAIGPGGHHFGTAHTQARFDSEFFATALADRTGYDSWQAGGAHDAAQRAHGMWRQLLAQYSEPPMEAALREELRAYVARRSVELRDAQLFT
jgi:trimethylamine--corrinoid protein Co-methyltransferase